MFATFLFNIFYLVFAIYISSGFLEVVWQRSTHQKNKGTRKSTHKIGSFRTYERISKVTEHTKGENDLFFYFMSIWPLCLFIYEKVLTTNYIIVFFRKYYWIVNHLPDQRKWQKDKYRQHSHPETCPYTEIDIP